jgi:hypothetical protein
MEIIDLDKIIREAAFPPGSAVNVSVNYDKAVFTSDCKYKTEPYVENTQKDTIDKLTQNNGTSQTQPMVINRKEEITNSYSWSTEHGFSVGIELKATFKVPVIGGLDTKVSTQYSFKSTTTKTEEKKRTWDFSQTVNVAPEKKVTAILMIEKTRPNIPFELTCAITGTVKVSGEYRVDGRVSLASVESSPAGCILVGKKELPRGFSITGSTLYFKTNGIFTAQEGINARIDLIETPLNTSKALNESVKEESVEEESVEEESVEEESVEEEGEEERKWTIDIGNAPIITIEQFQDAPSALES